MPVVKSKTRGPAGFVGAMPETDVFAPGWARVLRAGFERENTIVSGFTAGPSGSDPFRAGPQFDPLEERSQFDPSGVTEEFDQFEHIPEEFRPFAPAYQFAPNREGVEMITAQIRRELENDRVLEASGFGGFAASFAGGMFDPIIMFPPVRAVATGAKTVSTLRGGLATARAGFLGASAAEALLHGSQETRTGLESTFNVAGATLLSGVLGAGITRVTRGSRSNTFGPRATPREALESVAEAVERDLDPDEAIPDIRDEGSFVIPDEEIPEVAPPVAREVEAEVDAPDATVDVSLRLSTSQEQDLHGPRQTKEGTGVVYAITRDDADIGFIDMTIKPDGTAVIEDIVAQGRNNLGPTAVRSILNNLRDLHPEITDIAGERVSGARRGGEHGFAGTGVDVRVSLDRPEADALADVPETVRGTGQEAVRAAREQEGLPGSDGDIPVIEAPGPEPALAPAADAERGSVGAASALPTRSEETIKSIFGLEKILALPSPSLRMMTSPFLSSRRASQALATSAAVHNKNTVEIATAASVETKVKAHRVELASVVQELDRLWVKHRSGMAEGGRARRLRLQAQDVAGGRPGDKLSFKQFREQVTEAMRNDDVHANPEVAEAARFIRRKGFDPLKDRAIANKQLPEELDPKTALSYVTRMYNSEKIVARRTEFEDIVTRWLIHRRDTVDAPALAKAEAEIAERASHVLEREVVETDLIGKRGAIRKFVTDRATRDDQELLEIAKEITDRIISTPAGRLPYDAHIGRPQRQTFAPRENARGPLSRRVFLIPDEMIKDFLENDIDIIVRAYHRTMGPDVEIFGRFGDVDMIPQMKDIAKEAADATRLVDGDPAFKTPEARERARTRINKRKDEDIADLMGMLERLKNDHGRPDHPHGIGTRLLRGAREVNLLSKLGGMTISASPDVFRPVMVEGVTRVMRHAVVPLITNLQGLRMARAEAQQLGAIFEMTLDTRMATIADIGDDFGRHSKVERGLKAMTDTFGLVSLMAPWNQLWKEVGGTVTMGRILTESANWRGGTIKVANVERLAAGGIDHPMAVRIANQFDRFGQKARGVMIAGTENWTDRGAATAMRDAMIREVDQTIVTPGIGDRPFWMTSTQLGQNIGQFKSFFFASAQSVLLSGLQRRDLATLNGAILMVAMGTAVYYLKQKIAGREVSTDPAVWITEGIDRSGVLGWFFDANNIMEKVGLGVLPGGPTRSRYASRNVVGAMLGPTAGLSSDIASIVSNTIAGDVRASDTRALRRMVPYQNLFYMRTLLDKAGEAGNKAFGIPESRRKRKTKRRSFAR